MLSASVSREIAALLDRAHEHVRRTEARADVPHGNLGADDRGRVNDGSQRLGGDRERQHAVGMVMDDGLHVHARRIDGRMDHALAVGRAAARVDGRAVESELHEIVELDERGTARARQPEALGVIGIAHADVTEGIDHALVREDAICRDEPRELARRRALRTPAARHARAAEHGERRAGAFEHAAARAARH